MWIADCRQYLRDHAPTAISDFLDSPDDALTSQEGVLEWADAEGFGDLWRMQEEFGRTPATPAFDLAFRLFVNHHIRAILGCLLLSSASPKEMQTILRDHFAVELGDEALAIYRYVFWDAALLGRKGWEDFYKKLESTEERSYIAFGISAPTAEQVRDMLGLDVVHSDEQVVNTIISQAYQQFRISMQQLKPEDHGAMKWAELALRAVGVKKNAGLGAPKGDSGPTAKDFSTLFSVKAEKSSHISLAQLAGQVVLPDKKTSGEKKAT